MNPPCYIQALNDDILREIFAQLTFEDNVNTSAYPFYDAGKARAPLVLTYICSHWRQVAIGTPELWSRLRIAAQNLLAPCKRQELYRMWLDRAWGTPVSLHIIDISQSEEKLLEEAGWPDFLLEHAPCLKYLSTGGCTGNALVRGLQSRPKGSARHLEALRISDTATGHPWASDYHGKLSTLFPNLTQLELHGERYEGCAPDIPTNQLTHLAASICLFKALLSTGRIDLTFPRLVQLELHHAELLWQMRPEDKQLLFPVVQIITIHDRDEQAALTRIFLSTIHTPRLEALHIYSSDSHTIPIPSKPSRSGNFDFFTQFLSQAPCLRHVIVGHKHFLTTAFLGHPAIWDGVDHVRVTFSISTSRYSTIEDANAAFGEKWKEQGLKIGFSHGTRYGKRTVFVGWSRIPDYLFYGYYRRTWALAYWDQ